MRDRIVDFILLAALIVIAVVIVWTLFGTTFRRDVRPVNPTPGDTVLANPTDIPSQDAAESEVSSEDVQPVDLGNAPQADEAENALSDTASETPAEATETAETSEAGVTAVALDDVPDNATENSTVENSTAESNTLESNTLESNVVEDSAAESSPDVSETATSEVVGSPEPLPAGAFELERVGFSYVTGGPGSCGIVLEAWTHVAVSDDILADYPCGSEFTVALDETVGGRDSFTAVVGDTMNPANSRTVNIYVGEDEPALEYGVREGRLEP